MCILKERIMDLNKIQEVVFDIFPWCYKGD